MWVEFMKTSAQQTSHEETHQTVPLKVSTATGSQSIQIRLTDQRISAHAGLALMSGFLHRSGWREQLAAALPHAPQSPNAYLPVAVALGFMAGVWCGADTFSRVGHLAADPLLPEVLGTEALPSQPTLTRFFRGFSRAEQCARFWAFEPLAVRAAAQSARRLYARSGLPAPSGAALRAKGGTFWLSRSARFEGDRA